MNEEQPAEDLTPLSEIHDAEIRRFLQESLGRLKRALDLEVLVFSGSRVSGRIDGWSDIDLFHKVAQPHTHVDAICYTPEEYERMVKEPSLIREIMRTGLRII